MTATDEDTEAASNQQAAVVDYLQHFGDEGHARQLASLRVLLSAFTGVPGIIGLHGGLPPADAFPFTEMSFTLRDGTKMHITDPAQVTTGQLLLFILSWPLSADSRRIDCSFRQLISCLTLS